MFQTKVVGYCRLSDKDERSSSIPSQKKRIQEYCERYKLELLQIFVDDGKSGWTFNRPGFIDLEKFCKENKKVKLLIIPHFDRFSRADPVDAMVKERYFRDKLGVKVFQISEPPDTNTDDPMYQIMRFMQAFASNQERNRIVERVRDGIRYKLLHGNYCGSAPYGYKNQRTEEKKAIIAIDPARAEIVKFIFNAFLKGYQFEHIRKLATEKGFSIKGNSSIQKILANPVYAGLINVTAYKNQPAKIVKGLHPGIIPENDYWNVQEKLGAVKYKHNIREEVPLRGVLKCHICGHPMTAAPSRGRHGGYYWYYLCNHDRKENYSAVKIHAQLIQILDAMSTTSETFGIVREKLKDTIQKFISTQTKELMNVNLNIRKAEEMIAAIEERQLLNPVSIEVYSKVMGEKHAYLSELNAKRDVLKIGAHDYLSRLDTVLSKISSLRAVYEAMSLVSQQSFLKSVFGYKLSYYKGSYRTPFVHPLFADNLSKIKDLPLIIQNACDAHAEKNTNVEAKGIEPNPLEFLESIFAIFAA